MSHNWIDAFIRVLTTLGFIAGGVIAIVKYFDLLKAKASEKSVGVTKIKQFEDLIHKIENNVDRVQRENDVNSDAIKELKDDLNDLLHRISGAFFGKQ